MKAHQDVFRIRRNYNQWVANQTLEDYALRFTAKAARRWSTARVSQTALGSITFLALEAIGGAITLSYGFNNAIAAIMVVGAIIFLTGIPISYHAAKQGVDIDLLTRGAGFGYIGSTITSLIYASFTFIFFALEAAILALALELTIGIPLSIGYVISALMVIPLVTYGITLISRFQVWTQPLWIVLQILPLICIAWQSDDIFHLWTNFEVLETANTDEGHTGVGLIAFGAASAILFSLIAQIGEQVDFLRFLPDERNTKRWWFAMFAAGPGWIIAGVIKLLLGSFLAVLALEHGFSPEEASDPNRMYLVAFSYITSSTEISLLLLGVFVLISQLKINVTNAYAGSIAWSNFFSRLTHNHPGRVVWLVFNVVIALLLMELGIYRVLEEILASYAIIALAWVGTIVADLIINKPLGLRPPEMEFKRAHLYDINPVGVGSMIISSILGFICLVGWLGEELQALSSFIALGATFVCAPLLAWWTKGKYYIARQPIIFSTHEAIECCICSHKFEPEDMTHCPAYAGNICSLCCSLDGRCADMCKTESRFSEQLTNALKVLLPEKWVSLLNSRIGQFLGLFLLMGLVISSVLLLVYFRVSIEEEDIGNLISHALMNVFFILLIVIGVVCWMFILAHDSRLMAQKESEDQTKLLRAEILAHNETDKALQQAKEVAESANLAKSRYLTGISHELRSPLNAVMGYAQLLEKDPEIPEHRRGALSTIRRSSEHLADLIEGLLDISRIEAGRLELDRSDVHLNSLLKQLVNMFEVQARDKGINLRFEKNGAIPDIVRTDQKRLRQILINLLSNAIKYTAEGEVLFAVRYRNQVAEFTVTDSGIGLSPEELKTIFRPFERIIKPGQPHISGTGLGLTITQLLVDIMGGDIRVTSEPGKGSTFTLSLMLSSVVPVYDDSQELEICGYLGDTRNLFVVDDNPEHQAILVEMLQPLGFNILQAPGSKECLEMLEICKFDPHIFLLDISMPGINGWELAKIIRDRFPSSFILMCSANAHEQPPFTHDPHNGYLVKPVRYNELLEQLGKNPELEWRYATKHETSSLDELQNNAQGKASHSLSHKAVPSQLSQEQRIELTRLAQIGYVNAIREKLNALQQTGSDDPRFQEELTTLKNLTNQFEFAKLIERLETTQ